MNKPAKLTLSLVVLVLLGMGVLTASKLSGLGTAYRTQEVGQGPLASWAAYEGTVKARLVTSVMSQLSGSAAITTLASEGARVDAGDILVTLDASTLEKELLGLERDYALAEAERENLAEAVHPLRRREIELQTLEARDVFLDEAAFLEDSRELAGDGLVSPFELRQQEAKVEQARLRLETYEMEMTLTTNVVHPSELRRAEARAEAARDTLDLVRRQLESCVVLAPTDGTVVYLPLHVGGSYRNVRVGDAVFKNQPFLAVHDMRDVVVHCDVPEAELSRVTVGREVLVTPLAYPHLQLRGAVASIGSVAQSRPGEPAWKKYFHVTIDLRDADPALRSGMSVHSLILSHQRDQTVLIPRAAVWWEDQTPYCSVVARGRARVRRLELGIADEQHFEVVHGVSAGEQVRMP